MPRARGSKKSPRRIFHLQPGERLSWEQEIPETDLPASNPASASPRSKKSPRRIFPPPTRRAPLRNPRDGSFHLQPVGARNPQDGSSSLQPGERQETLIPKVRDGSFHLLGARNPRDVHLLAAALPQAATRHQPDLCFGLLAKLSCFCFQAASSLSSSGLASPLSACVCLTDTRVYLVWQPCALGKPELNATGSACALSLPNQPPVPDRHACSPINSHLDADTTPSIRLLSLVHEGLKPGQSLKWVPWQYCLSSRQYQERMEAKSARAVRSELQLLSQAFFDDTPEVSVEHSWVFTVRRPRFGSGCVRHKSAIFLSKALRLDRCAAWHRARALRNTVWIRLRARPETDPHAFTPRQERQGQIQRGLSFAKAQGRLVHYI